MAKPRNINRHPASAIPQPAASNTLYVIGRKGQMLLVRESPKLRWLRQTGPRPPADGQAPWTLYALWSGATRPVLLPVNLHRQVIDDQGAVLAREVPAEMVERVEAVRAEMEEVKRRLIKLEQQEQELLYEVAEQGAEIRVKGMLPPKPLGG